jgi:hypothetical protein
LIGKNKPVSPKYAFNRGKLRTLKIMLFTSQRKLESASGIREMTFKEERPHLLKTKTSKEK